MPSDESNTRNNGHCIRVCSAQIASVWEEPEKTLRKAETFIRHAADCGAKLICFPEQFATGWDPQPRKNIQDIHGNIVSSLQRYAGEYGICILGSLREAHDPFPKNTAIAIGSDGRILASYAKMHLFSLCHEHEATSPGTDLGIFTFDSLICGMAICYDLRFPELFRLYAQKGRSCSICSGSLASKPHQALGVVYCRTGCRKPDVYHRGKYDRNYTGRSVLRCIHDSRSTRFNYQSC